MATPDSGGESVRPSPQPPSQTSPNGDSGFFDKDATQKYRRSTPNKTRESTVMDPNKSKRDDFIMDTNNSSIVSKRSVEKLYYSSDPEYFRYFVSKFKRRSPLINRGYWLRMKAIDYTVTRFLAERTAKRKVVINLGCG